MISIALATYNGEPYIRELLDSIAAQTLTPYELVVCDDCSRDRTLEIIKKFKKKAPFPVQIRLNEENLGLISNFSNAVELCRGRRIALCDQDDRWLPDKLERLSRKMEQMETNYGEETPLLVHSDAIVAGSDLSTIARSLWRFQGTNPAKGHTLNRLLSQNVITGCTTLFNRSLWLKARPIPHEAIMHDWWLALVASAFGMIEHVSAPTVMYRQHGTNDTGAKRWVSMFSLQTLRDRSEISENTNNQAQAFLNRFGNDLSDWHKAVLNAFINLSNHSFFIRKYLILRYGLHYHGPLRNIGNLVLK